MKIARSIYFIFSWLFVLGVVVQVFFAGMVVVAMKWPWNNHITLGHTLAAPLLIMLISMYFARLPRQTKWMTWALFGVYFLQADVLIFLRVDAPVLSALHPVMALIDFALGITLARRAGVLRQQVEPSRVRQNLETVVSK
jgi:hypothetical protein